MACARFRSCLLKQASRRRRCGSLASSLFILFVVVVGAALMRIKVHATLNVLILPVVCAWWPLWLLGARSCNRAGSETGRWRLFEFPQPTRLFRLSGDTPLITSAPRLYSLGPAAPLP